MPTDGAMPFDVIKSSTMRSNATSLDHKVDRYLVITVAVFPSAIDRSSARQVSESSGYHNSEPSQRTADDPSFPDADIRSTQVGENLFSKGKIAQDKIPTEQSRDNIDRPSSLSLPYHCMICKAKHEFRNNCPEGTHSTALCADCWRLYLQNQIGLSLEPNRCPLYICRRRIPLDALTQTLLQGSKTLRAELRNETIDNALRAHPEGYEGDVPEMADEYWDRERQIPPMERLRTMVKCKLERRKRRRERKQIEEVEERKRKSGEGNQKEKEKAEMWGDRGRTSYLPQSRSVESSRLSLPPFAQIPEPIGNPESGRGLPHRPGPNAIRNLGGEYSTPLTPSLTPLLSYRENFEGYPVRRISNAASRSQYTRSSPQMLSPDIEGNLVQSAPNAESGYTQPQVPHPEVESAHPFQTNVLQPSPFQLKPIQPTVLQPTTFQPNDFQPASVQYREPFAPTTGLDVLNTPVSQSFWEDKVQPWAAHDKKDKGLGTGGSSGQWVQEGKGTETQEKREGKGGWWRTVMG